jgi:serine protease Do
MKATLHTLVVVMAVALLATAGPESAEPSAQTAPNLAAELSNVYAGIASRLEASVVSIDISERVRRVRRSRDDVVRETEAVGSGFIIDPAGYILTNNHVVDRAERIVVRLSDGTELVATIIGVDPESDLAVLRVTTGANLPEVSFADSDAVLPGHLVLALGSPYGFTNSVSAGIVSANRRALPDEVTPYRFIQTDASIHPGNSGGPLVNMAGEVVGVNTAVIATGRDSTSGPGFALAANTARDIATQLRENGRVVRGSIGVTFNRDSAAITRILPGGPASLAGLQAGDIIVSVAGEPVGDGADLQLLVERQAVGTTVSITVMRNGNPVTLQVGIADRDILYTRNDPESVRVPIQRGPEFRPF